MNRRAEAHAGIATSYRQFDEGMRKFKPDEPPRVWQMVTDYIAGDTLQKFPRGSLLQKLLHRRQPNACQLHYRSVGSLGTGLIMADNLSGMLNAVLNSPDSEKSQTVWGVMDSTALIWHETKPNFDAVRIVRPEKSPPHLVDGAG